MWLDISVVQKKNGIISVSEVDGPKVKVKKIYSLKIEKYDRKYSPVTDTHSVYVGQRPS